MNKLTFWSTTWTVALALSAYARGQEQPTTFRGEVSDSQCALNVHSLTKSHQEMLKSKSGAAGKTPATCSLYCVAYLGGKFVLTSRGHVYHLDNQELPKKFVGEKVRLRGVLDPRTEIIYVVSIEAE